MDKQRRQGQMRVKFRVEGMDGWTSEIMRPWTVSPIKQYGFALVELPPPPQSRRFPSELWSESQYWSFWKGLTRLDPHNWFPRELALTSDEPTWIAPSSSQSIGKLARTGGDWHLRGPIAVGLGLRAPPTRESVQSGPGRREAECLLAG